MSIVPLDQSGGTVVAATPIIDQLASAPLAAYGLRKLRSAYAGKAFNVRRDNDNSTMDIGFNADGSLDTVTLKTFVGSNNGFVVTWYDQSGNGFDATQATNANQPRIVNAGAFDTTADGNIGVNLGWNYTALDAGWPTTANNIALINGSSTTFNLTESYTVHCDAFAGPGMFDNVPAAEFIWSPVFFSGTVLQVDHGGVNTRGDCYGDDTGWVFWLNNIQYPYKGATNGGAGFLNVLQFPYGNVTAQNQWIASSANQKQITIGCWAPGNVGFGQQTYNGWILELLIYANGNSLSTADRATLFANQKSQFGIDIHRLSDAFSYVMTGGYSTRRLRKGYRGFCLTVRRDSDNTTKDIGFATNNDNLDTAALLTFVGSANGYVTKWYDQSVWANHLTQSTAANQPQIVSSGSLITQNGRPILLFNSSVAGTIGLANTSVSNNNGFGAGFIVEKSTVTSWPAGAAASPVAYFQGAWNGSIVQGLGTTTTWTGSFGTFFVNNSSTVTVTGNLETLQSTASQTLSGGNYTEFAVGCIPSQANTGHPGYIGEVYLVAEGVQTGPPNNDITLIYQNQKAWWGTP